MTDITALLRASAEGDTNAEKELYENLHTILVRMACQRMKHERPDHTLQPTALVHELFLRLRLPKENFRDRNQFFRAAGRTMRWILVEHARRKNREKRGGSYDRIPVGALDDHVSFPTGKVVDLLALDEALEKLGKEDSEASELVHLVYFAGLPMAEAAAALGISLRTAERRWMYTRARLAELINGSDEVR